MAESRKTVRCAIYTRKSTEDGLEQDFNSLDAQREACAAYIMSQAGEGWEALPELYDDGGYSGGSMERPGLKQLLADIESHKVDVIVVYKVDRLTRSLADFAKIVDVLDSKGASFVSVTQAFNTTTSMGRLTLNVLLSFAQFEREVTGERIRDKIAASKKKGMWMGGTVPLGYEVQDRKLIINEQDARTVRHMFRRYAELRSVPQLADDFAAAGYGTKLRSYRNGRSAGGTPFQTGPLAQLLQNPLYVGKVRHKDHVYDGEHDAIIDQTLFDKVQAILATNRNDKALGRKARNPSLLTGMISDPDGRPMTPTHACRGSKRYRYYMTRLKPDEARSGAWRLPSGEIERVVMNAVSNYLASAPTSDTMEASVLANHISDNARLIADLPTMCISEKRKHLLARKARVQMHVDTIIITLMNPDGSPHSITIKAKLVDKGSDLKLAIAPDQGSAERTPDPVLLRLVAHAFAAQDHIVHNRPQPMVAMFSKRYLHQLIRLSYLAPDIITAILNGTQPPELTGRRIMRQNAIPLDWAEQRQMFGFV